MGILIKYNGFPVAWKSAWIKARCVSSGEAETYALSECVRWGLHIKYIGEELSIDMPDKPTILSDATAALGFAGKADGTGKLVGKVSHHRLNCSLHRLAVVAYPACDS